jgi:hypothetical protein
MASILEADPKSEWMREKSPLFQFLRWSEAHPDLRNLPPEKAWPKWRKALPDEIDPTFPLWEMFQGLSMDDVQAEFFDSWGKFRYLPGDTPLEGALELALQNPLELREGHRRAALAGYVRFLSLAGWLQVEMGDRNILLPVMTVAELLGVKHPTISRYRHWAMEDGFLIQKKAHRKPQGGYQGDATEFRFDVSQFPILAERAQASNGDH